MIPGTYLQREPSQPTLDGHKLIVKFQTRGRQIEHIGALKLVEYFCSALNLFQVSGPLIFRGALVAHTVLASIL